MSAPEQIWELGKQRQLARAEKNFSLADQLRSEIAAHGWDVVDIAGSFELHERKRYVEAENVKMLRPIIHDVEIAIAMIVDGFQEDAAEAVKSVRGFSDVPVVVMCLGEVGSLERVIDEKTHVVHVIEDCGWGQAANAILNNVQSTFLVLLDPSTRLERDAVTPVLEELRKGEFVAVGWRGGLINLEDDWRSVDDKGDGEVDVLFSYFLALDRSAALEVGGFNSRAIYYRNADIEFSLRLRHASGRLLQMTFPLTQSRHHGYHDVDPNFREVQSKKNYDRILERFRGKNAILSPRR